MSILVPDTSFDELPELSPLKVLLADDHPLVIAGIRRTLERTEDIEIVGEARTAQELLELIERRRPELVLTDLRMTGANGTECIQKIRATWPEVKIVVLSACDDRASIEGALAAGANAYIVKSVEPVDIASVLRQTAGASAVFHATPRPQQIVGRVVEPPQEAPATVLTDREQTILAAVAAGKTTAAISQELWVSEHTVKFHLTNIYRKLGVPNRAAAVRLAVESGLVAA
jgi:DNA-binding NarL/FixJ family response regulator